ncbi:uncharacterized protein ACNLHF_017891 isoform 2-T2 [Anomaloglossus baeobatrachus]|uniref:uncharacterized protein LOC142302162 isoform X2 n=1 Tax=Anomaloglossus baeobatrachus TaxID=238106 RepID=UPI003F4F5544
MLQDSPSGQFQTSMFQDGTYTTLTNGHDIQSELSSNPNPTSRTMAISHVIHRLCSWWIGRPDKDFQTCDGQNIFSVHSETEKPGPILNLYLKDSYGMDVVRLYLLSYNECDDHETYLQIVALPNHPVGHVKIDSVSGNLNICIRMTEDTSTYIASLPMFLHTQKSTSIEILNMKGSHQVAKITGERGEKSMRVIFKFLDDVNSCAKTVILGAFLYLSYHLHEISRLETSSPTFKDLWIINSVDWENRFGLNSQRCDKVGIVDVSNNKRGCCRNCGDECRDCLCFFGELFLCCAECCNCCLTCVLLVLCCTD